MVQRIAAASLAAANLAAGIQFAASGRLTASRSSPRTCSGTSRGVNYHIPPGGLRLKHRLSFSLKQHAALAMALGALVWIASGPAQSQAPPPAAPATPLPWAYALNPPPVPGAAPPKDDGSAKHVPGSSVALLLPQTRDLFNPPDWYPDDHPPTPDVVAHGRRPDVRACGYCHLPNGQGRPQNASLAGLSAAYIEQQMADYRNGLRKSSVAGWGRHQPCW